MQWLWVGLPILVMGCVAPEREVGEDTRPLPQNDETTSPYASAGTDPANPCFAGQDVAAPGGETVTFPVPCQHELFLHPGEPVEDFRAGDPFPKAPVDPAAENEP